MLVEDMRIEERSGVTRFVATVRWEDQQHDPVDVFFAVHARDAWRVGLAPDAYRVPAAVVAFRDSEARLSGGGPMCAVLHNGLANSLAWLARWSDEERATPAIDLPLTCVHHRPEGNGGSALFISGGVDSTAALVANHNALEPDDPLRVSVGIVVVGIQLNRWIEWTDVKDQLDAARDDLAWVEAGANIDVVPVVTNIRALNESGSFWKYEYQGAALAGVGHLFSRTISNLTIASTWEIRYIDNWGSHPVLDPGYGSHSLRIWHELAHLGRLEKTRLVSSRPELISGLNVCNRSQAGGRNCGRCEKCIRTRLALESLGGLAKSPAFDQTSIQPRELRGIRILDRGLEGEYLELIRPLDKVGRSDLSLAIKRTIRRGRFLRMRYFRLARSLGSRIFPRTVRERVFGKGGSVK